MKRPVFLSAQWEYLSMLNYKVDPAILSPYIPPHTELDFFEEKALVSVVGFLFNDTRVLGIPWPGHVHFEEVNLRYYLKRYDGISWQRGVGFVSEIVPKPFIAKVANTLYNEHYSTAKMAHAITETEDELVVKYRWKMKNKGWNEIKVSAVPVLLDIVPGSEEEFILEHYIGYNELNSRITIAYTVEHPRWQVYPVKDFSLQCDTSNLYGEAFVPYIDGIKPHSVFLARGSNVVVRQPVKIRQ